MKSREDSRREGPVPRIVPAHEARPPQQAVSKEPGDQTFASLEPWAQAAVADSVEGVSLQESAGFLALVPARPEGVLSLDACGGCRQR